MRITKRNCYCKNGVSAANIKENVVCAACINKNEHNADPDTRMPLFHCRNENYNGYAQIGREGACCLSTEEDAIFSFGIADACCPPRGYGAG